MMNYLWAILIIISVISAIFTGRLSELSKAVTDAASGAFNLAVSVGSMMCLWQGILAVMSDCGITAFIGKLLRKPLSFLMPEASKKKEIIDAVSANVSANLLGLANAATPFGLKAAKMIHDNSSHHDKSKPSDDLCTFIVLNSASIQLIPTTVAAIRASLGAASPYDILPCVILTSTVSVAVGLILSRLMSGRSRNV